MVAMASFHTEKCCHLVSKHEAFTARRCSSSRQFLIYSTFSLVSAAIFNQLANKKSCVKSLTLFVEVSYTGLVQNQTSDRSRSRQICWTRSIQSDEKNAFVGLAVLLSWRTVAVLGKYIWGAWPLIIWEATTAKQKYYRTHWKFGGAWARFGGLCPPPRP